MFPVESLYVEAIEPSLENKVELYWVVYRKHFHIKGLKTQLYPGFEG
jgi:hypothetical protein